ncbi:FmdB family zinc ribbon protein [Chloroflexota bacterium]
MIIEFQCKRCGDIFNYDLKIDDIEDEVKCPECGRMGPQRVYSWYSTKSSVSSGGYT